jgi:hypothetical protein
MYGLLQLISTSFTSRERRGWPQPEVTSSLPTNDLEPIALYARVLEEARERRGGLSSRP